MTDIQLARSVLDHASVAAAVPPADAPFDVNAWSRATPLGDATDGIVAEEP